MQESTTSILKGKQQQQSVEGDDNGIKASKSVSNFEPQEVKQEKKIVSYIVDGWH